MRRPVRGRKKNRPKQPPNLEPGPGYRPDRDFTTPEEFRKLPEKGQIDPQRIRTSQDGFDEEFGKPFIRGNPESKKIDFLVNGLKKGDVKPEAVEPVIIVEWRGHIDSVDHRRLIAFRRAGISIPYIKTRFEDLSKGKQKRIRGAPNRNNNGAYIRNEATKIME